jgi:hypothetical protein
MSGYVFERLRALFVEPAIRPGAPQQRRPAGGLVAVVAAAVARTRGADRRTSRPDVPARTAPATLGVLAGPDDAGAAAAALALAAAGSRRRPCAVICRWTGVAPEAPASRAAVASARRLSRRMSGRGLSTGARGRLVTVALPAAASEARAAAERAVAAAGDTPVVVVVAGPRPAAFDPLLANLDLLVVVPPAGGPAGLEALARASAAHLDPPTSVLRVPSSTSLSGRIATDLGLLISPSLRAAATAALEGDRAPHR